MLLQFSVKNFKTFKDKASLNLVASNYDKDTREFDNIYNDDKFGIRLLKSAVVYGSNASGKSKFFEALSFMKYFVISSSKESQKGDEIDTEPFKLSSESENSPSEFEVIFTHNNVMFRYGFEVDKKNVISEWLYYKPKTKEIELFYRDGENFETHSRNFTKGKTVIKKWLQETIVSEGYQLAELNFIFCSDEYLLRVNQDFLQHDYYTDVITFDNSEELKTILGDIFISIDRVKDNAKQNNATTHDELCRIMIHGTLHLLGYKDKTKKAKTEMTSKEDFYLASRS